MHERQKTLQVCQLRPPSEISDMRLLRGEVCFRPRFLSFREKHMHTSLPLLTAYPRPGVTSSQQQGSAQFPSIHEYPLEPFPAMEKHLLLGQEHPALLESPDRAGSRAGCECEERTMNGTILMAWPTGKALRALQQAPGGYTYTCIWITIEIHSLIIPWLPWSQYKVHSRWLISEKCNIGSVIMSYRQHTKCLCSTTESKFVK